MAELPADVQNVPMPPLEDDLAAWLADQGAGHVHAGAADHLGIWRGKRLPAATAVAAAEGHGVAFSEGLFGLDIAGGWVEPPAGYEGWYPSASEGYPDIVLQLLPETATVAPWLDGEAWVLGSWQLPGGEPVPVDPRACLESALDALARHGRSAVDLPLLTAIATGLADSGVAVEALSFENGVGQLELNIHYDDALHAADTAFMVKQAIRAIAARNGMTATFMAKPQASEPGSSCHVHLSLWSPDGSTNVFAAGRAGELGELAEQRLGGLLATLPAATAFCLPNANSYARLVPDALAPVRCDWAAENRAVALRTIAAPHGISRIEHRLPGADVNPYLALAAFAAGILIGIEGDLRPPPGGGDAPLIPATPAEAAGALLADGRLAAQLGTSIASLQALMLRAEAEAARTRVSGADRARYLELA